MAGRHRTASRQVGDNHESMLGSNGGVSQSPVLNVESSKEPFSIGQFSHSSHKPIACSDQLTSNQVVMRGLCSSSPISLVEGRYCKRKKGQYHPLNHKPKTGVLTDKEFELCWKKYHPCTHTSASSDQF